MPSQKRPTAVTVMAILNIVFGSLGLIASLCLGVLILGAVALFTSAAPNMQGEEKQMLQDMYDIFARIPGVIPFFIASTVISVILAVVLLSAGIGLLGLKKWARNASIFYAIVTIVLQIASFGYQTAVLNPGMEKANKELEELVQRMQQRQGGGGPAFQQQPQNPFAQAAGSVFGAVIGMAYAIALLIVMYNPTVVAAFAGRGAGREETEYDEDGGDWGRERDRGDEQ